MTQVTIVTSTLHSSSERYIIGTARVVVPTDERYQKEGYCGACNDEREEVYGNPSAHDCGLGDPIDGLLVSIRDTRFMQDDDLQDLPY